MKKTEPLEPPQAFGKNTTEERKTPFWELEAPQPSFCAGCQLETRPGGTQKQSTAWRSPQMGLQVPLQPVALGLISAPNFGFLTMSRRTYRCLESPSSVISGWPTTYVFKFSHFCRIQIQQWYSISTSPSPMFHVFLCEPDFLGDVKRCFTDVTG